jgi:hypothetical protein
MLAPSILALNGGPKIRRPQTSQRISDYSPKTVLPSPYLYTLSNQMAHARETEWKP